MGFYDREASIIIPTCNRSELLEFTLLSLYEQTVAAGKFEVIVVDDGSTDNTEKVLFAMKTPYRLKVVHNRSNTGAAAARNRGIEASRGEIIIFLDEMLVDSDYVEKELRYQKKENMVISTIFNGQNIYTHFYPEFSPEQRFEYMRVAQKASSYPDKTEKKGVLRLFRPRQIVDHSALRYGLQSRGAGQCYGDLQVLYGKYLEGMAAPWFLFVTNSASLSRRLLYEAGLFDEKFKGVCFEEWELGYRLHQAGAVFYNADDINCFHQAHPYVYSVEKIKNYLYFAGKFPVVEVQLIPTLWLPFCWNLLKWGKVVTQFKELRKSVSYEGLSIAFQELASVLCWLIGEIAAGRFHALLQEAGAGFARWDDLFQARLRAELALIKQAPFFEDKYGELIKGFEDLLRLPVRRS